MPAKKPKPPITEEHINDLFTRLQALGLSGQNTVWWQTFGGMEYLALNEPLATCSEFFDTLERHLVEVEKDLIAGSSA